MELHLAHALRKCLEDLKGDGDCWQDKLAAPVINSAQTGSNLSELYDSVLEPGPSAGAPDGILTVCAARSG